MDVSAAGVWVRYGVISRAHGVRGELRVEPDASDIPFPADVPQVRLVTRQGQRRLVSVTGVRQVHRACLLTLDGVAQREEAQLLRGAWVELPAQALPALGKREFYYYELAGLDVFDQRGNLVGKVRRVVDNGAQPILVVCSGEGTASFSTQQTEHLIPLIEGGVIRLDRAAGAVTVDIPDGLLE